MTTRHGGVLRIKFHERFRFCPNCGVAGLRMVAARKGFDLVHDLCGFSFRPMKSELEQIADELCKRDRSLRNQVTMNASCVGEDVAAEFGRTEDERH